jgi:tetratricopeptide (TPR) repeat protein
MSRMLALWGEGKSTPAVLQEALGATPGQIDQEFRADSARRLSRYSSQFVPMGRVGSLAQAKQAAEGAPADAKKQTAYAFALLREGQIQAAEARLGIALKTDGKLADALFLSARIALGKKRADDAARALASMVGSGQNGFAVQMLLADAWQAKGDMTRMQSALTEAARFDPTQSEPLLALAELAKKQNQPEQELAALRKLAALEQHEPVVYRRLLRALNARRGYEEAVRVGEAALYADLEGWETHALFAEALAASKMLPRAIYELETAVLCPARPSEKAAVHAQLAQTYLLVPNRAAAVKHAKIARALDKDHPRVKQLKF